MIYSKILTTNFNEHDMDLIFNNFKSCKSNLLYTNCIGKIKIGDEYFLSRQFDTYFCSPENDFMVLIERDINKSNSDVRKYLTKKNISFNEVRFMTLEDEYEEDVTTPTIAFAREKGILHDLVKDSKEKSYDSCTFYPKVTSELIINYNGNEKEITLQTRSSKGLVVLPDKYIFIIDEFDPRNINTSTAISTLIDLDMDVMVNQDIIPQEVIKEEKGRKILCKKI